MGKREDQAKEVALVKKLEALAKWRELTARRREAMAHDSLPNDMKGFVIDYDKFEPSPSNRSPKEALDWVR